MPSHLPLATVRLERNLNNEKRVPCRHSHSHLQQRKIIATLDDLSANRIFIFILMMLSFIHFVFSQFFFSLFAGMCLFISLRNITFVLYRLTPSSFKSQRLLSLKIHFALIQRFFLVRTHDSLRSNVHHSSINARIFLSLTFLVS